MSRILFELAAADAQCRFSPFVWRVHLALRDKGLAFETRAWHFTDKAAIAASGQGKVPVLVDGERVVHDSWAILRYLETRYPERPLADADGWALARFYARWCETSLAPALRPCIFLDLHARLGAADQTYFRETREALFGMSLETLCADIQGHQAALRNIAQPLTETLVDQDFLHGAGPGLADTLVFSHWLWPNAVSARAPALMSPEIRRWFEAMRQRYDGLPGYVFAA